MLFMCGCCSCVDVAGVAHVWVFHGVVHAWMLLIRQCCRCCSCMDVTHAWVVLVLFMHGCCWCCSCMDPSDAKRLLRRQGSSPSSSPSPPAAPWAASPSCLGLGGKISLSHTCTCCKETTHSRTRRGYQLSPLHTTAFTGTGGGGIKAGWDGRFVASPSGCGHPKA